MVSGTAYARAIMIPNFTVMTTLSYVSIGAETGGTHCWAALLDSQRVVRAVSADNTGATFLSGSGAAIPFTITSGGTYTTSYDGLYYAVICAAFSGTAPTLASQSLSTGIATISPAFCGTSTTGLSTPPSLGTQFNAVSGSGTFNLYAWTS
jgi:hypothetical protein